MQKKMVITVMAALMLTTPWLHAQQEEKRRPHERGFWFYEDPPKKEKKEKKTRQTQLTQRTPLGPLPPYQELMKAHPDDLKKIFDERLKEVVWRTTPQNMYAFMLVKDVTRRKALAVTQMHTLMLLKKPNLNMNTVRAQATFARGSEQRARINEINKALRKLRGKYALIYFRSETCIFCKDQDKAIKFFRVKTGWGVKVVDVDRKPALAKSLGISMTPTVILIRKGTEDYMPVAVGATSADEMTANIYRASRLLSGEIEPQQFYMYEFDKGGPLDPLGDPTQDLIAREDSHDY